MGGVRKLKGEEEAGQATALCPDPSLKGPPCPPAPSRPPAAKGPSNGRHEAQDSVLFVPGVGAG